MTCIRANSIGRRSADQRRRRGSTLVEVLAASVIVGSAVTTMLVAQSRSLRQLEASQNELVARHMAKRLIAEWRLSDEKMATPATGSLPNKDRWDWIRSADQVLIAKDIKATQVNLRLVRRGDEHSEDWVRQYHWLERREEG